MIGKSLKKFAVSEYFLKQMFEIWDLELTSILYVFSLKNASKIQKCKIYIGMSG